MPRRSGREQAEHAAAVRLIAEKRFPQRTCCVLANPGREHNRALTYTTRSGVRRAVYPDIVALMEPGPRIVAVGEVETASTVTAGRARQWKLLTRLAEACYVFVPLAAADVAARLVEGVERIHLRTYAFDADGNIVIDDVH